jgi:hypothetical protein
MATETTEIILTSDVWTDLSPADEEIVSIQNQDLSSHVWVTESATPPDNELFTGRILYPRKSIVSTGRNGARVYAKSSAKFLDNNIYSAKVSVTR